MITTDFEPVKFSSLLTGTCFSQWETGIFGFGVRFLLRGVLRGERAEYFDRSYDVVWRAASAKGSDGGGWVSGCFAQRSGAERYSFA